MSEPTSQVGNTIPNIIKIKASVFDILFEKPLYGIQVLVLKNWLIKLTFVPPFCRSCAAIDFFNSTRMILFETVVTSRTGSMKLNHIKCYSAALS